MSEPSQQPLPIVVLISGSGTNLQAIIDAQQNRQLPVEICAVVSNKADVKGLRRAEEAGIKTHVVSHVDYASREEFDAALIDTLDQYQPGLVVLAGFMRVLTAEFVNHYLGRLLNIHPSLLPKYPGLNTHQRVLDAGEKLHGATVHFVTPELDGGPAIIQSEVTIRPYDDAKTLAHRVQSKEHIIYPRAIQWFAEGRLQLRDDHAYLDGEPLAENGYLIQ